MSSIETKRTKKYPSFPLDNKEIMAKVDLITRLVETSIFALPFLAKANDNDNDKPRSIDEIKDKLTREAYVTTNEIFDDMEDVFESRKDLEEISFTLDNDNKQRRVNINVDEKEKMRRAFEKSESIA